MNNIRRAAVLILSICLVFASSSYVKAYEDDYEYPDASGAYLSQSSMDLYITDGFSTTGSVAILNAPDLYDYYFDYECSNPALGFSCYLDITTKVITFYVQGTGSGRVTFTLNNKQLYLDLRVSKVKINKTSLLVVKKKKATLKIKGCSAKLKWVSTNKKVASVSSKGVVKGKKIGNALIYTKLGNGYLGCAVSVISKKMNRIIKKAYSLKKGKYSQAKRMKKGYYDCSSLVWRAYKKGKVKLVNKYYAPVAADLAKYYVKKKKRIKSGYSKKNVAKMKLRPGDLYFCEGQKNGRYRGIYHVEMFTGYRCLGISPNGTATIVARWATVPDDYYMKDNGLMVRPIK